MVMAFCLSRRPTLSTPHAMWHLVVASLFRSTTWFARHELAIAAGGLCCRSSIWVVHPWASPQQGASIVSVEIFVFLTRVGPRGVASG
jgi:hypothetical protein